MPTRSDLFVDTSAWAISLDQRDGLYAAFSSIITRSMQQHRRLVTSDYIIAELVALLTTHHRRITRAQVISSINAMWADPNIEIVHIDESTRDEAWRLLETRQDKEWSLVDASSFVLMRRHSMTEALTTDHHFAPAGFSRIPAQP